MFKIILCVLLLITACTKQDETPKLVKNFGINLDQYTGYYKIGESYNINGSWHHPRYEENFTQIGDASWYGPKFHGNITANGERYNKYALTAAHPTLPMPSVVKVTNTNNDLSVIVMVNDRGPFNRKGEQRIIDISEKAAEIINMKKQGVAKVKIEYLPVLTQQLHKELGIDPQNAIAKDKKKIAAKAFDAMYKINNKPVPHIAEYYIKIGNVKNKQKAAELAKVIAKTAPVKLNVGKNKAKQNIYSLKIGPVSSEKEARLLLKSLPKQIINKHKYVIVKAKN